MKSFFLDMTADDLAVHGMIIMRTEQYDYHGFTIIAQPYYISQACSAQCTFVFPLTVTTIS